MAVSPSWRWKKPGGIGFCYLVYFSLKIIFFSPDLFDRSICSFFKINYFNWRLITILWWVLPYIDMNQPWVFMCSPS